MEIGVKDIAIPKMRLSPVEYAALTLVVSLLVISPVWASRWLDVHGGIRFACTGLIAALYCLFEYGRARRQSSGGGGGKPPNEFWLFAALLILIMDLSLFFGLLLPFIHATAPWLRVLAGAYGCLVGSIVATLVTIFFLHDESAIVGCYAAAITGCTSAAVWIASQFVEARKIAIIVDLINSKNIS